MIQAVQDSVQASSSQDASANIPQSQDAAQAIDSLQAEAPSIVSADTSSDTTLLAVDVLSELGREVTQTGQLLVSGKWQEVVSAFYEGLGSLVVTFIPRIVSALFVLILFYFLYRVLKKLIWRLLSRSSFVEAGLERLLIRTYTGVAITFICVMVLAQFGINVNALMAGLSIVGIAVGFAAQDTVQNFISGITILIDRPFKVGQFIEVDSTFGRVEDITMRSTRVRTLNNEMMVMPNTQMINQKLINYSQLGLLRISIPFGIAYKEFPETVRSLVLALAEDDERLHPNHKPDVVVTQMADSSVQLELRLYVRDADSAAPLRFEYTEKILDICKRSDVEIPFPHMQLHIDEARAFSTAPFMQPK